MKNNNRTASLPPSVRESLKEVGDLIACARKEKRWTQEELARRIGVNRMTVVRIEKGAPEVATGWYLTAAWLLGLPILTWQTMGEGRSDSVVGDLLTKLKKNLPKTVRRQKKIIDNDF
ncbi:MAG: helix-turn-helix transcriptional regulator [Deltaproteobacteria bacterium]|nr:helix-turn-helix transcriptional regulator [Deltaproteobacteria bacterium]